ncbi:hypothetical protein MINS_22280 [Mycolicibacterium insubricum]|uniref:hypothetical protein n=1 Tax=Mycolicibacterium insubricum TaxID=444597 RepID=UPI001055F6AE|nr:hypothetical protein [Mycolicibacterium insubricum]MCB9439791.1 hypothetical protein [Mycolicibacterium sp.]BBZ66799.1 hypothetical protein MINS_22280 [Mycolicibacterium insubricum]
MSSRTGHRGALQWLIVLIVLATIGIPALPGRGVSGARYDAIGQSQESAPVAVDGLNTAPAAAERDGGRAPQEVPRSALEEEHLIRAGGPTRLALVVLAVLLGAGAALWSARGTRGPPRPRDPRSKRSGRDILQDHCVHLC